MKKIKKIRENLLKSNNLLVYLFVSRMWSFLYAIQLSLEVFKFRNYWVNLKEDVKDNISNCDSIYRNTKIYTLKILKN